MAQARELRLPFLEGLGAIEKTGGDLVGFLGEIFVDQLVARGGGFDFLGAEERRIHHKDTKGTKGRNMKGNYHDL